MPSTKASEKRTGRSGQVLAILGGGSTSRRLAISIQLRPGNGLVPDTAS